MYPLPSGAVGENNKCLADSANIAWDIVGLQSVFDRIDGLGWYAACPGETGSPYVWLEGEYQDHEVFLQLLPGSRIRSSRGRTVMYDVRQAGQVM